MFVGREPTSQSHKHMLSSAATPFWNNAVWLVKTSPVTFVSQSECFISEQRSYASLNIVYGIGSWSSDNGRRLMSWRSWVRIPAPFTEWTFSHLFVWKNEITEKDAGDGPFKKEICFVVISLVQTVHYFTCLCASRYFNEIDSSRLN